MTDIDNKKVEADEPVSGMDRVPKTSKPGEDVRFSATPSTQLKSKRYTGHRLSRNIVMIGVSFVGLAAIAAFALIVGNEDPVENARVQKKEKEKEIVVQASEKMTEESAKSLLDAAHKKAEKEKAAQDKALLDQINANKPEYSEDGGLSEVDKYEREKLRAQVMNGPAKAKVKKLAAYEGGGNNDGFLQRQIDGVSNYIQSGGGSDKDQADREARNAEIAKKNQSMPENNVDSNDQWRASQYQLNKTISESPALKPEIPPSKYILSEGSVITVALTTSVDTLLPGKITARTIEDIYDSINGNYLLIPRGTNVIGSYNTNVLNGQNRVFMAFNRLVFPNGASMQIGSMTAGDPQGRAGIEGEVFSNFWKMLGTSFLIAGVSTLAENNGGTTNNYGTGGGSRSSAGQILADTAKANIDRYMQYHPKITIQAGEKITIVVAKDMELNPSITRGVVVKDSK